MAITVLEHLPAHLWDLREHQHHLPLLCPVTSSDRRPAANEVIPHLYLVNDGLMMVNGDWWWLMVINDG